MLVLLGAAGLAAAFGLAAVAPGAILAVPLTVVAAVGMVTALRLPGWGAATAVVLSLLLSGVADDLPAGKAIFGFYLLVFLLTWHIPRWASGERLVVSWTDAGAALLILLGIGLGLVLGVLFGNPVSEIVIQLQAFVPVLLYFPIKQTCARERLGPELMAGALIVLGIVAATENAILTRQALQDATKLYEIIDVRVSYGEIMMMAATMLATGLLMSTRTWTGFASYLPLFGIAVGGLILSKSRGFWVATVLALAVLFVMSRSQQRRHLAGAGVVGFGALLVVAFVVAPQYVMLLGTGIAKRFLTLSTAASADLSLINRFAENAGVWRVIRENPVVGHGWGATYSYYSLLAQGSQTWGFVHNAYFGVWLKLGLWGLMLVVWVWAGSAACGVLAVRDLRLSGRHRALAGAAGASLLGIALVSYASSPFELADQMTVLTALWAVAQGTAQRARGQVPAAA
ncbi:MAG TPA: O-antigen ligase family protein [Rubricoccaceae bacterium]